MKHIKCGNAVTAKAKITTVLFNTFSVLSKDHLILTPTQIIGDNIDFEFEKTVYCRVCKEDIPLDSDQISVGISAKAANPADLFKQAMADYQRGQFDLARQGFQEYLDTYPKTDISDDAAYWIGECNAAQKKPREAIAAWEKLIKLYPDSDKGAAAHLKKGLAHVDPGEKAQAIVELQFVVHEYPRSDEAKSARQRLRTLGADVR